MAEKLWGPPDSLKITRPFFGQLTAYRLCHRNRTTLKFLLFNYRYNRTCESLYWLRRHARMADLVTLTFDLLSLRGSSGLQLTQDAANFTPILAFLSFYSRAYGRHKIKPILRN